MLEGNYAQHAISNPVTRPRRIAVLYIIRSLLRPFRLGWRRARDHHVEQLADQAEGVAVMAQKPVRIICVRVAYGEVSDSHPLQKHLDSDNASRMPWSNKMRDQAISF